MVPAICESICEADHRIAREGLKTENIYVYNTSPGTLRADVENILASRIPPLDPEKKTLIKVNGNHDKEYPGSNTSRWFLDALLSGLVRNGFRDVSVIEGAGYLFSASQMIKSTRLIEVCDKYGVPFIDYEGLPRDDYGLPQMLRGCQLINVPVMHTHGFAVVSCATKNYFGLIPNDRWKYHERLEEKLVGLREAVNRAATTLTIVDGTVGQKGDSTRTGDPVKLDLIVVGKNELAIDAVVSGVMGFSADEIPLLKYAKGRGGMEFEIDVGGDYSSLGRLPRYDFTFSQTYAKTLSKGLHRNPVTKFFVTRQPLMGIFHKARGLYQDYVFLKKKNSLFSGTWMAYEEELIKGDRDG